MPTVPDRDIARRQPERDARTFARGGSGRTKAIAIDSAGNYRNAILAHSGLLERVSDRRRNRRDAINRAIEQQGAEEPVGRIVHSARDYATPARPRANGASACAREV